MRKRGLIERIRNWRSKHLPDELVSLAVQEQPSPERAARKIRLLLGRGDISPQQAKWAKRFVRWDSGKAMQ